MKVLVERHDHETPLMEFRIECPRCHSELLVDGRDVISATFARMYYTTYTNAIGKIVMDEQPNLEDTYTSNVVLCPVCDSYIREDKSGNLLSIIDQRIK